MPYIDERSRKIIDPYVDVLIDRLALLDDGEGVINYIFSRVCGAVFRNRPRYRTICLLTGVLTNVKDELYRRVASPYEDTMLDRNGDVPEYKE